MLSSKIIFAALTAVSVFAFQNKAMAWEVPCESSTGYCARLAGTMSPDGKTQIVIMIATPLSGKFIDISEDSAKIEVPVGSSVATLVKDGTQIELGTVSEKAAVDTDDHQLTLNSNVTFKSEITRHGKALTCIQTALGVYERHSMPVVEVITTARHESKKITITSVVSDGEETSSYWWGLACRSYSEEIRWNN